MDIQQIVRVSLSAKDVTASAASLTRTKEYAGLKKSMLKAIQSSQTSDYALVAGNRSVRWRSDSKLSDCLKVLQSMGFCSKISVVEFVDAVGSTSVSKTIKAVDQANGLNTKKAKFTENVLEWMAQNKNSDSLIGIGIVNQRTRRTLVYDREKIEIQRDLSDKVRKCLI